MGNISASTFHTLYNTILKKDFPDVEIHSHGVSHLNMQLEKNLARKIKSALSRVNIRTLNEYAVKDLFESIIPTDCSVFISGSWVEYYMDSPGQKLLLPEKHVVSYFGLQGAPKNGIRCFTAHLESILRGIFCKVKDEFENTYPGCYLSIMFDNTFSESTALNYDLKFYLA